MLINGDLVFVILVYNLSGLFSLTLSVVVGQMTNELLIVGDSINDYNFSKNVGANFVGIINQYGVFNDKQKLNPNYILVHTLKEMIEEMSL